MDAELQICKEKMEKACSALEHEFMTMRVGRANTHVLDKVKVDYYGTISDISQVANISIPEARLLEIKPWDMSIIKDIEKAINEANIGMTPNNDGKVLRLSFPALTEDRRKELAKDTKSYGENSKVAVRNARRDAIDKYKKLEKDKEITSDDLKSYEKEIQDLTDSYVSKIDSLVESKVNEIMTV